MLFKSTLRTPAMADTASATRSNQTRDTLPQDSSPLDREAPLQPMAGPYIRAMNRISTSRD